MLENKYKIFDTEDNKVIFEGTAKECGEVLGVSSANIHKANVENYYIEKRYKIYEHFEQPRPTIKMKKPKKLSPYETELLQVKATLKTYGNCLVVKWKDELYQDLVKDGFTIEIEVWKNKKDRVKGQPKVSYIFKGAQNEKPLL